MVADKRLFFVFAFLIKGTLLLGYEKYNVLQLNFRKIILITKSGV